MVGSDCTPTISQSSARAGFQDPMPTIFPQCGIGRVRELQSAPELKVVLTQTCNANRL